MFTGKTLQYLVFSITVLTGCLIFGKVAKAASITSISPTAVVPGNVMTIAGSGFGANDGTVCFTPSYYCVYTFNDGSSNTWNDTSITAVVPSSITNGTINVYSFWSPSFNITGPAYITTPVLTDVKQLNASGQLETATILFYNKALAITGSNFGSTQGRVTIGGQNVPTIALWSDTHIVITAPDLPLELYSAYKNVAVLVYAVNPADSTEIASNSVAKSYYWTLSNDTWSYLQTHLPLIGAVDTWNVPIKRKQLVAIIDDGVYTNHPDLKNTIWRNIKEKIGNRKDDDKNGYVDDIYGWNFVSKGGEMTTQGSHGTMVAGIIAAARNNTEGIAGINPNVTIMPLIVCGDRIGCPTPAITKAIRYAADNGATIINLSLGTSATTGYSTDFNAAVKYANDKGVIIVVAAGNGDTEGGIGQDLKNIPQSPVCNDVGRNAIIGVGAITDTRLRTSWSNYGSSCVDVYAPGVEVVSTSVPTSSSLGELYDVGSGTSFSAPIITGLISLVKQQYPLMPYSDLLSRLYRNQSTQIIDAVGFVGEAYTTPLKIREADLNKAIKVDKKVVAKFNGVVLRQTKGAARLWFIRPTKGKRFEIKGADIATAILKLSAVVPDSVINSIPSPGKKGGSKAAVEKYKGQILRTKTGKNFWYVNPKDGKKYVMQATTATKVLGKLSVPVSPGDLGKVPIGLIE